MLMGTSLSVNTLVKVKEGLLGQRELEIDRYCRTYSETLRTALTLPPAMLCVTYLCAGQHWTCAFNWWQYECTEIQWRDPQALGPILKECVHMSWRKTSQLLHGLHIHQTCHPLTGMLWTPSSNHLNYFRLLNREIFEPINACGCIFTCVVRALMFAFAVLDNSCYCP